MATTTSLTDSSAVDPSSLLANNNQANIADVSQIGLPSGTDSTGLVPPPASTSASPSGLVTGAMSSTPQPGTPNAAISSYTPALGTVSNKETVSGQVNDLLNQDNPIMQTARTQAAQAANSRGLLNSSMAVQSGEQAAINSALPIATQDASTYHDTSVRNQAAENEAGQFNTGAQNQSALLSQSGAQEQVLQKLRGDQATNLANIEANYKTVLQSSASAASLYSETVKSIGAILDDPNTTADQKQAAVDKQIALLQSGLTVIGGVGNVDLAGLLDFSTLTPAAGGTPAQGETQAAPATAAQGQPAPAGTQGAGHNVGDQFIDNSSGRSVIVMPDGSLQDQGGSWSG